ncbi:ImmA/IrrE family metallo-endopeptidase [Haloferula sp. A504]|uniref:ImmA/IrrE family metallo-endopeptidase n=1 Tax=Haloferula sp. A504 TaxID=3373601 RepID=UPI0031C00C95|nr:ImmA/IrrE family metallo-endopeptidase [Verrucomicrobiaceae bacterium E54]
MLNRALAEDNSDTGRHRNRSTQAHEIGHGVLHENLFIEKMMFDQNQGLLFGEMERQQTRKEERIVCRESDVFGGTYQSPWYEVQANRFMASILMPKPLFYQVVEPLLLEFDMEKATPRTMTRYFLKIDEVSTTFDVSNQMARIAVDNYLKKDRAKRREELFN